MTPGKLRVAGDALGGCRERADGVPGAAAAAGPPRA